MPSVSGAGAETQTHVSMMSCRRHMPPNLPTNVTSRLSVFVPPTRGVCNMGSTPAGFFMAAGLFIMLFVVAAAAAAAAAFFELFGDIVVAAAAAAALALELLIRNGCGHDENM